MNLEEVIESKESKGLTNKFCKWARKTVYILTSLLALEAVDMVFDRKEALGQSDYGKLTFQQVLKDGEEGVDGLDGAFSIAVSPDSKSIYVASVDDDAVAVFQRDLTNGKLTFLEDHKDNKNGVDGLDGIRSIIISPDAKNVYVASKDDNAIAVFQRDLITGKLIFLEYYKDGVNSIEGLGGAFTLTISPDSKFIYVGSWIDRVMTIFQRDLTTGKLTLNEIRNDQNPIIYSSIFYDIYSLLISNDNKNLYVGTDGYALTILKRDTLTGSIAYLDHYPKTIYDYETLDIFSLSISPDDKNLYLANSYSDDIAIFQRDLTTGRLTFLEAKKDGVNGVDGLSDALSITISLDGKNVYIASSDALGRAGGDNALAVFSRDQSNGKLTFLEVLKDGINGVDGLDGACSVVVSPDGINVYAAGRRDNTIAVFKRNLEEVPSDTQAPTFSNYFPSKNATNVSKNTNIAFDVTDASGVIQSSLEMTVEGSKINPAVTSITNGFHLLYDPSQDFNYNQQVDVTVKAKDNSQNQNQGQDSWYFTISDLPEILTTTIPIDIGYKAILTKIKPDKLLLEVIVENNSPEGFKHLKELSWYSDNLTNATNVEFFFKTEDGKMHSFTNEQQDLTLYENIKTIFPFLEDYIDKAENFHDYAYKFLDFLNKLRVEYVKPQNFTINKDKPQIYINNDLNRNDIEALSLSAPNIIEDSIVVTISGEYRFKDFIKFSVGQREYLFPSAKVEYGAEVVEWQDPLITKQMRDYIFRGNVKVEPTLVDLSLKNVQVKNLSDGNPIAGEKTKIILEIANISNYNCDGDLVAKIEPFDIKGTGNDQKLFNKEEYKDQTRLPSSYYPIFKKFHLTLNKQQSTTKTIDDVRFFNKPYPTDGVSVTLVSDQRVGRYKYFEQIDFNNLNNFAETTISLQNPSQLASASNPNDFFPVIGSLSQDIFYDPYNNFKAFILFSENKDIAKDAISSIENLAGQNYKSSGNNATDYLRDLTSNFTNLSGDSIQTHYITTISESWREYNGELQKLDFVKGISENLAKDEIATIIAGTQGEITSDLYFKDNENETYIKADGSVVNNVPVSGAYNIANKSVIMAKIKPDKTYTTELKGTATGTANVTIINPKQETIDVIEYENVPLTSTTVSTIDLATNTTITDYGMKIDNNNDGRTDQTLAPTFVSSYEKIKGDIDGNNKRDIFDLLVILKILGNKETNTDYIRRADLNGDGTTNIFDLLEMLKLLSE